MGFNWLHMYDKTTTKYHNVTDGNEIFILENHKANITNILLVKYLSRIKFFWNLCIISDKIVIALQTIKADGKEG